MNLFSLESCLAKILQEKICLKNFPNSFRINIPGS
jgi:hypothetical protein